MTINEDRDRDGHTIDDDARGAKDDVKSAARTAADKTESMREKVSNAVEDLIPGDSDGDGH
jgi:hypothetical protein